MFLFHCLELRTWTVSSQEIKKEWNIKFYSNSGWIVKFTSAFSLYCFSFKNNICSYPYIYMTEALSCLRLSVMTSLEVFTLVILFLIFFFLQLQLFDRYWHFWPTFKRKKIATALLTSQETWIHFSDIKFRGTELLCQVKCFI